MLDAQIQQLLVQGLQALPYKVRETQIQAFCRYLVLLNRWNNTHNLTSVRKPEKQVILHVLDCLTLVPFLSKQAKSLADIGSGAGLPALMVAIMCPDLAVFAVESHGKKAAFIRYTAIELGLDNVEVVHQRVESWQPVNPVDIITSRAMSSGHDLLRLTEHISHSQSVWLLMKAKVAEQIVLPGFSAGEIIQVSVPFLEAPRHILKVRREEEKP